MLLPLPPFSTDSSFSDDSSSDDSSSSSDSSVSAATTKSQFFPCATTTTFRFFGCCGQIVRIVAAFSRSFFLCLSIQFFQSAQRTPTINCWTNTVCSGHRRTLLFALLAGPFELLWSIWRALSRAHAPFWPFGTRAFPAPCAIWPPICADVSTPPADAKNRFFECEKRILECIWNANSLIVACTSAPFLLSNRKPSRCALFPAQWFFPPIFHRIQLSTLVWLFQPQLSELWFVSNQTV